MNYNNPTLREHLASHYALGALQGAARARFEQLLRRDFALRQLVDAWQNRLAPLSAETPAVTPPARVFAAIQRRIDTGDTARPGLWARLGFWRALSAIGAAAVVVLAITTTLFMLRPPAALSPSYVAILSDNAAQPALVVTAFKGPWRLNVEALAATPIAPGKVLQVWAVEKDSGVVRPLVTLASGQPQQIALTEAHWKLIKSAHSLTVSIEPAGATAAAPTTAVLYSGLCLNLKGV